ncbi:MAG: epoxide hydrolase [Gammaproteobacteria bacterium]|nr:epoxide hydrolase [Gammaproteobacteria bacterium]
MSIPRPYQIKVPEAALSDLKTRLARTRWPDRELVSDWTQGIPLNYVQEVCVYWQHTYDWRRTEERLNSFDNFLITIDGVDIHYILKKSPSINTRPLLITHGWPGSIVEFLSLIDLLALPQEDGDEAFDVVVPSLPGFGFSGKPKDVGWGVDKIAGVWVELMNSIGYSKFLVQGGDWGAAVSSSIAANHSENCLGIHTNMPTVGPQRETLDNLTEQEEEALRGSRFYQEWDSGYSKQQSTRPQTLGYGLVDSPAAQAAWILEKFYQWTDCDGHPENAISRDELLDNVMMYWLSGSGASSARIYWESFGRGTRSDILVPSGCSIFPKEIFKASRRWVEAVYKDLRYYNVLERGGHFAAFEDPKQFALELRSCFSKI